MEILLLAGLEILLSSLVGLCILLDHELCYFFIVNLDFLRRRLFFTYKWSLCKWAILALYLEIIWSFITKERASLYVFILAFCFLIMNSYAEVGESMSGLKKKGSERSEREREKLTQSGGCSRGWNSYGNPRWGRTKACASSHGHQFHSCTRLSESDRAPRSYSPRTQNPTHLSLALPHFPCTSTTFTCAMNINKNEEHKLFNIGCIWYFLKISRN